MCCSKEFVWLAEHSEEEAKHKGEYIAVVGERIVAYGSDLKKVLKEAQKYSPYPLIHKVPKEDVMVV